MRFKKLLKQYPKLFSIIIIVFGLSLLIGAYIASYCVILPLAEKTIYKYYAYDFYIPVEYLRLKSNIIWEILEWGYETCGGKISALDRRGNRYSYGLRELSFNDKNVLVVEILSNNKNETIRKYYNYKGKLFAKFKFTNISPRMEGIEYDFFYNRQAIIENGVTLKKIYRTPQGQIVAECIYKNNEPWNGSIIDERYEAKITYKNGKQIKIEDFDLNILKLTKEEERGKGWPEIKDFSFPFKYGPEIYVDPKFYYEDAGRYK